MHCFLLAEDVFIGTLPKWAVYEVYFLRHPKLLFRIRAAGQYFDLLLVL